MHIPHDMLAAVVRTDEPQMSLERIPTPSPRTGEALVKVAACGVCHTDLHVLKGEVAFPRPAVLGHEISGQIVAFGPQTHPPQLKVGDLVVAAFIMPCTECGACSKGRDDMCEKFFALNRLRGVLYDGETRLIDAQGESLAMYSMAGLAEYAVVPVSALTTAPHSVDLESAAIIGCAGLTAYGAVVRAGAVKPGSSIAIVGVGGIGSSLIPLAKSAGAETIIGIDIQTDKLERAVYLGATHVVNSLEVDAVAEVRKIVRGGVDVAFEALGNPATFRQAVSMLADGGRMVAIGIAAGAAAAEIEITPLVRRGYEIVGSFGGRTRVDLPALIERVGPGGFDPRQLISRSFTLEDVNEAYGLLAQGQITGRAIITMPSGSTSIGADSA